MLYTGEGSRKRSCVSSSTSYSSEAFDWVSQRSRETFLIEKAQSGDLAAFNELVLTYQDSVFRQALWMLREEEAAEDAVQETFLKAYRKIHTFMQGKPFQSWLLRITTNQCLDMIRSVQRHPVLSFEPANLDCDAETSWIKDPADTPEQAVERAEIESNIARAIHRLPPEYRTAIILVDLQELDYAEASAILNVPLGTMKSRVSRARQQLREALQ